MSNVTCVLHHHIGPETPFEAGLNVASDRKAYEAQINWMSENFNFISLDQLLSGDLPDRPLLLTFDDVFRSVLDVVREVLAPNGIPSVYFINPGLFENDGISLDSALAWATGLAGTEAVCRLLDLPARNDLSAIVVSDMAALGAQARREVVAKLLSEYGLPDLGARAPILAPEDLRELVSLGVEIGNHTMTHVHCRSLSAREREVEIVDAKARLEALCAQPVRSLSIPYGHEDDLTRDVLDCARSSGHEAIFLVHARANWRRPAKDIWYRVSLHDEAPGDLRVALSVKPHLRTIKKVFLG